MKNKLPPFLAGIICTVILFASVPALGASLKTISVRLNAVNIEVNGEKIAAIVEDYTLANGVQTAGTISYNNTTYVPVRRIGELLGIDIGWDQKTQSVLIGGGEVPSIDIDSTIRTYDEYKNIWNIEWFTTNEETLCVGAYRGDASTAELFSIIEPLGVNTRIEYAERLAREIMKSKNLTDINFRTLTGDLRFEKIVIKDEVVIYHECTASYPSGHY